LAVAVGDEVIETAATEATVTKIFRRSSSSSSAAITAISITTATSSLRLSSGSNFGAESFHLGLQVFHRHFVNGYLGDWFRFGLLRLLLKWLLWFWGGSRDSWGGGLRGGPVG